MTPDHVNPERPWPALDVLREATAAAGLTLAERLTAHPEYVLAGEPWIDPRVAPHVRALADPSGLARPGSRPVGLAWQEPERDLAGTGRVDLHTAIDSDGRLTEHRSDFVSAFGDWDAVREDARAIGAPARLPSDVSAALRAAERSPADLTDDQALALMTCDGPALEALTALADAIRADVNGESVTYVVNRNINFTNICYTGCRFCAFAQRRTDADAYSLSLGQVADRAEEAWAVGATEVCMQGGIDPELSGTAYFDLVRAVKDRVPDMHVHAFSPMEVVNGATKAGLSIRDWLTAAREAGLDTIPGTAAEILDDEVRWVLTKGKLPTAAWIEVVTTAHAIGPALVLDDDVRPRRHPGPLGRAPQAARAAAGPHRRVHRVRPAAVRAHQLADLPGRRRPAGSDRAGQPRRARDGPAAAARAHRQHPDLLGEARRRRARGRCCGPASTTSAGR